jgi:hypothetical protein
MRQVTIRNEKNEEIIELEFLEGSELPDDMPPPKYGIYVTATDTQTKVGFQLLVPIQGDTAQEAFANRQAAIKAGMELVSKQALKARASGLLVPGTPDFIAHQDALKKLGMSVPQVHH